MLDSDLDISCESDSDDDVMYSSSSCNEYEEDTKPAINQLILSYDDDVFDHTSKTPDSLLNETICERVDVDITSELELGTITGCSSQ